MKKFIAKYDQWIIAFAGIGFIGLLALFIPGAKFLHFLVGSLGFALGRLMKHYTTKL